MRYANNDKYDEFIFIQMIANFLNNVSIATPQF